MHALAAGWALLGAGADVTTAAGWLAARWCLARSPRMYPADALITALQPVLATRHGTWIGWPGAASPVSPDAAAQPYEPFELDDMILRPVPLTAEEMERYYEGFCNSSLWPLYHDAVEQPVFRRR